MTASAAPDGRKIPPRAVHPAPSLGAFSAPITIPITVSGLAYLWQGTLTFAPQGSESVRFVYGTGSFKLVTPPPPPPVPLALASLTIAPASILTGQSATVTIALNRAPGVTVQVPLLSADGTVATVAPFVTIQPAQTTGTAAVTTLPVATVKMVSIIATYNGQSKAANLQVNPLPPPPPPPPAGLPLISRIRQMDGKPVIFPLSLGVVLKVEGTSFGSSPGKLYVNGYPMPTSGWSDTAVSFTVAEDATRQYPGWVTVERPDGKYYSGNFNKDGSGPVPEPPLFDAFYDAAGNKVTQAIEGTVLTLRGSHFGKRGMVCYSGWAVCEIVSWSDTQIVFKAPFAWWDKRVSSVEVFSGSDPSPSLSGRKALWPGFTVLPNPANPGPPRVMRPEVRRR